MTRNRTFIHHDGALGDLLLSLPAFSRLKRISGFVHLAGRTDAAELLLEAGMIDEFSQSGSARYASLFSTEIASELREFLAGFDNAVVFTTRADSDAAKAISSVVADTRIILTIPPNGVRQHVADYRLCQLPDFSGASSLPRLTLPPGRMEQAKRYLADNGFDSSRPLIFIHPGSGGSRKCWPIGNYRQLLAMLSEWCDPFIILLTGPAENETVKGELDEYTANHREAAHVQNAELAFAAALISLSDLYIGNDSGISHLASFVGARSLVFFGPTDPVLWKPLGENVLAIQSGVECAPCGDEISRGCLDRKCIYSVSAEYLNGAMREFFPTAASGKRIVPDPTLTCRSLP